MTAFRHLLGIEGLAREDLEQLLDRAAALKRTLKDPERPTPLRGRFVANLFFEDSTRTRTSFEMAAKMLGAEVLNWTAKGSSVAKGETTLDSIRTIDALGPVAIVMRHASSGAPHLASRYVRSAAIVNAGDGTHEHPSQALLDSLTLREKLGTLEGKRVLIVGDILHSRVARSNLLCLRALGARVVLCGPPTLLPAGLSLDDCEMSWDLDAVLGTVDAVMVLRLQLERQTEALFPSPGDYARRFGMNQERASRLKPGTPVLHPGPMNRGVEISSEVADGESSAILDQVHNGVAVRMAILERCA